jgi:hypothetical protein
MHWLGDITPIWHPAAYETFSQTVNFELMFDTLIRPCFPDPNTASYCPDLADSWTTTDAQNYTFKIHQGVKWQDGTPFSIDDIIWTINESQKWSPGRYKNTAWDAIEGAKAVRDGTARRRSRAQSRLTTAPSRSRLENPDSNWYEDLSDNDATVLPQHILKDLLKGVAGTRSRARSRRRISRRSTRSERARTSSSSTGTDQYTQFDANRTTSSAPEDRAHLRQAHGR